MHPTGWLLPLEMRNTTETHTHGVRTRGRCEAAECGASLCWGDLKKCKVTYGDLKSCTLCSSGICPHLPTYPTRGAGGVWTVLEKSPPSATHNLWYVRVITSFALTDSSRLVLDPLS